ncbi:hydroxymethylbilane synthase [Longibacter salinarum]|uniref:Porphobilinogen deaminase n=1 Tax=Longibacter salinarum TaxID=1850348 RepID=A0A2A8D318_9BACT|nr:hydroxymethylbilane synthase [Longibacter salinarum]PEN15207.1 hydroxymethylbilane synthase [Longibacter salinarum]
MPIPDPLVIGTRGSELALWQANFVKSQLEAHGHRVDIEVIVTRGDQVLDVPISEIGDEAVFTKELDRALLAGDIHVAVHSLKDLPSRLPSGITLAAIGEREDPGDAFVPHPGVDESLDELPEGAVLATASLRRRAQIKAWRPDIEVVPVRGNVDSRLEKLDDSDWHGMVLAMAGLLRMGLSARIGEAFPKDVMVPAVGQGALGIACASDEHDTADALQSMLHHEATAIAVTAERSFMQTVGGGCQVPTGAFARFNDEEDVVIDGCIAGLDGEEMYRERRVCTPEQASDEARDLAQTLLDAGGAEVLDEIIGDRTSRASFRS